MKIKSPEYIELDKIQGHAVARCHNYKHLKSCIDGFVIEKFEGEYDIYEIAYIKYISVKQQRYLKAAILRSIEKRIMNID